MDNSSLANPISSFGNSFSTGFWSGGDWRWRWEGRRGWGTDIDHSWNSAVYPEFRGLQPYKEQKLRKRLYMPISYSSLTVAFTVQNFINIKPWWLILKVWFFIEGDLRKKNSFIKISLYLFVWSLHYYKLITSKKSLLNFYYIFGIDLLYIKNILPYSTLSSPQTMLVPYEFGKIFLLAILLEHVALITTSRGVRVHVQKILSCNSPTYLLNNETSK